jgi:hypothetical protein
MKTLIDIDKTILNDYLLWENGNKNNWDITSYLNEFYDINAALAFSKLFFPDFIEKKDCIILGFRYDEKIFKQWYDNFNGDISSVERYCNLYDVADYFHINSPQYASDELYQKAIDELAKALKASWEANCKLLFPDKKVVAEVFSEYDVTRITLYTVEIDNII